MKDAQAPVLDSPTLAQSPLPLPAVVDYVIQIHAIDNPLGLQELHHKKRMDVWRVLVRDGEIVEVQALTSSHLIDERYLLN